MTKIAIVGAGLVGSAWAISFARAGFDVDLWDEAPAAVVRAFDRIEAVLPDLDRNDLLNGNSRADMRARLNPAGSLEAALKGAVHVQENTPERVEIKRAIFSRLDEMAARDVVIASSTSGILPSSFTEHLSHRDRCLVVHPLNPPYLIPATEIVPAPWTSVDVVERTRALLVSAGQAPLVMKRELDGFIMNRLQGALLHEAFRLVADGYASVEDVDTGIRDGLALRWSLMGPFETIDLNAPGGIRDFVDRYGPLYAQIFEQMSRRVDWSGEVLDTVETQRRHRLALDGLEERQLWRDRRLMALAAQKNKSHQEHSE